MPTTSEGLLTRVRKAVTRQPTPVGASVTGGSTANSFITQYLGAARQSTGVKRGIPQFLNAYNTLPWYRAAVGKISHSISGVEWLGLTEDPETEQMVPLEDILEGQKHPIEIFLSKPNPFFSWQTVMFLWSVHLRTTGEAFGVWDSTPEGMQIWPITPNAITKLPTPAEPAFMISLPTGQFPIPMEEVFWMIDPDPVVPYSRGSGVAQSLDDELSTDDEAAKTVRAFFEKQARPDILITGKGLNPEKTKKIEEDWIEKQSGFWNAFKPHFMSEAVEVTTFQQDFQAMQFIPLRQYERDTIIQVFGIPPEIIGILSNSNRATIEAADLFFSRYTLTPILNQMREAFQKQLVPKFDDTGLIEIDFVSPIQEDKDYKLAVMTAAPYAFLIDEVRAAADEEPLPDEMGQRFPLAMNIDLNPLTPEATEPTQPTTEPLPDPTGQDTSENPAVTDVPGSNEPNVLMPEAASMSSQQNKRRKGGRKVRTGRGYVVTLRQRRRYN